MASGVYADTAPVLYFSNINYNDTTALKSSFVSTNTNVPILNNASNYEVAINKLKISDLSSIVMGYLPNNEYQVALQLEDSNGATHFQQAYVALPNSQPITTTYQYIASVNADYTITLYKYKGTVQEAEILTFTPQTSTSLAVIPNYVVYDSELEVFLVITYLKIYLYNSAGVYQSEEGLSNIVSSYYSTLAQALLVCVNVPVPTVYCYRVVNGVLLQQWTITDSKDLGALTNIACASTDAQNVIVCWYSAGLPYATIYNYASQLAENEGALPAGLLNISSCLISSADGTFAIGNNSYDPTLSIGANVNNATPYNNWNIYGINPYVQKTASTDNITSIGIDDNGFAFGVLQTAPYNYSNVFWSGYNFANFVAGLAPTALAGTTLSSLCYMNSNMVIAMSFTPANVFNPTACQLNYIHAGGAIQQFYNLPSVAVINSPNTQISINANGYLFAVSGGALYMLDNPIILTGTAPTQVATVAAGSDWVLISSNETVYQIQSIVWDDLQPNIGYAIATISTNIFKVVFNPANNTYSACEWFLSANQYYSYIMKATDYPHNTNATITKLSIQSYTTQETINLTNTIISGLALSRVEDYMYAVSTLANPFGIYDYKLFANIGSINGINPLGLIGIFTSTETIPPTQAQLAFYDLQVVVNATNEAYLLCYNALKADISGVFPVASCPFWTLDTTTKKMTLTYDPKFESEAGNGIYADSNWAAYFKLPTIAGDQAGFLQYVLNPTGISLQTQESIYKLIFVDKIVIKTNMTILSDYEDTNTTKSNQVFTDLDLDTSDQFFDLNGSFLYSAVLLRNYILLSNTQLRAISYQIYVQYKDGSELPYQIPVGENVSIKFQFSRLY